MSLLDGLLYGLRDVFDSVGNQLPRRSRIKFTGTVTDDAVNDMLVVGVGGGGTSSGPPITNSSTGTINDVPTSITGTDSDVIRFTNAAGVTVTGFDAGSGGTRLLLARALGGDVTLSNEGGGSATANRVTSGTGLNFTIPSGYSALLKRDSVSLRWSVVGMIGSPSNNETPITTTGAFALTTAQSNSISLVFSGAATATATWVAPVGSVAYLRFLEETGGFDKVMTIGSGTTYTLKANTRAWVKFTANGVFPSGAGSSLTVAGAVGAAQLNSGSSTLAATTTNAFLEGSTSAGFKVAAAYVLQVAATLATWSVSDVVNTFFANFATRSGLAQATYTSTNTVQTLYSWTVQDNAVTVATGEVVWTLSDGSKTGDEIKRLRLKSISGAVTLATVRVIENADTDDTLVAYSIDNSGSTIRHRFQPNFGTCRAAMVHTRYERLMGS